MYVSTIHKLYNFRDDRIMLHSYLPGSVHIAEILELCGLLITLLDLKRLALSSNTNHIQLKYVNACLVCHHLYL